MVVGTRRNADDPRPGRVLAEYACAADDADGAVQMPLDGSPTGSTTRILPTDSRQDFATREIGIVEPGDGEHLLSLRGTDFVGALWKLRGVRWERVE